MTDIDEALKEADIAIEESIMLVNSVDQVNCKLGTENEFKGLLIQLVRMPSS